MSSDINLEKFELANKWIRLQNKGISIPQHLRTRGIQKIVLYGASEFALRLLEQCENEAGIIEIVGISDKKISSKGDFYCGIPLVSIRDIKKIVSEDMCVVITAMGYYEEILGELHKEGILRTISLQELIYDACC